MGCSVLQGTSAEQDNRFSNKDKKLMKEMKFAESLAKKVRLLLVFYEVSSVGPWRLLRVLVTQFCIYCFSIGMYVSIFLLSQCLYNSYFFCIS